MGNTLLPILAISYLIIPQIIRGYSRAEYIKYSISIINPFQPYYELGIFNHQFHTETHIVSRLTLGLFFFTVYIEFYE